jgi:DNA (cytosine-5)-methyltransferase 1
MITVGELFAGIGGLGLGLEMTGGFKVAWQVEINDFSRRVLEKNWPDVTRWKDVCTFPPADGDWTVDMITAGFPCQDISVAGKAKGLEGERSGLFYEVVRIGARLRPRYILLENVSALLVRGAGDVLRELAEIGYDAEWHCLSAATVAGAPHIRDRIFILAYPNGDRNLPFVRSPAETGCLQEVHRQEGRSREPIGTSSYTGILADTLSEPARLEEHRSGRQERESSGTPQSEVLPQGDRTDSPEGSGTGCEHVADSESERVQGLRTTGQQILPPYVRPSLPVCESPGGRQHYWQVEPNVGRVVNGVSIGLDRAKRIKALGNAVVPQVSQFIGEWILTNERNEKLPVL